MVGERNLHICGRKRGGHQGVAVDDAADAGIMLVDHRVHGPLAGGAEVAVNDLAVERDDGDILCRQLVIGDGGGLDHHKTGLTVAGGEIAAGVHRQTGLEQLTAVEYDLFSKILQ